MAYTEDKLPDGLDELTTLASDDVFVVGDQTDSDRAKKISKTNLITDLNDELDHDTLSGFVANEHVDHSAVSTTAGVGLTGGGDHTATRTIDLDISTLTDDGSPAGTDEIAIHDGSMKKTDLTTAVDNAGATMNTDTDVSSNSWVLDEDDMSSDSNTKVPTQQSVKAYVDDLVGTTATFTAAENISSGDAVSLAGVDSPANMVSNTSDTGMHNGWDASGNWFAQPFTTSADTNYIYSVTLELDANNVTTNVVVASIRADSSGPTGADINGITGSVSVDLTNGGDLVTEIIFDAPVPVSGSTTYHVVLRNSSQTAQDTRNSEHASSGTAYTSANSGSTWSSTTTTTYHVVKDINYEVGQIYKADASSNNHLANGFVGFATEAITAASTGSVQITGRYTTSGLTAGALYHLTDTAGSVDFTPGTQTRRVGKAISTTELLIQPYDIQ